MPIVNAVIKTQVTVLLNQTKEMELAQAQDAFAQGIADIIEAALKSATVTVAPGIPVTTAGSPSTQTGVTTAPGTGSLS